VNTYELVLLQRTGKPVAEDDAAYAAVHQRHLDHLEAQRRSGQLRMYGGVTDAEGTTPTSVYLFRTGSLGAARAAAEADPLVAAGYLSISVHEFVSGWRG